VKGAEAMLGGEQYPRMMDRKSAKMPVTLSKQQIIEALRALDEECRRRGIMGEISIYGGTQMVLVFDARPATRDVDAVFSPKTAIRDAARAVAQLKNLPADWMNDAVKGYLSGKAEMRANPVPELEGLSNLRFDCPTPEYLLAMKCLAARGEADEKDKKDAAFLAQKLKLTTAEELLEIVSRFYPEERIHVKTRYFAAEIMDELAGPDSQTQP
jgi:hypothetical protein